MFSETLDTVKRDIDSKADKKEVQTLETKLDHTTKGLESQMEYLKSRLEDMKSRVTVDMTELQARENRKLNLIFFNVPESDSVDADIRKDDDKSTVQEALHDIGIETAMVTDFQRLGKPDPSTDNLEKKKTPTEINPRVAGRKKMQ